MNLYSSTFIWNWFFKRLFLNSSEFPLSSTCRVTLRESNVVEISQSSNWAFFPTGRAFIYIGEPGARREIQTWNLQEPFWKHGRKTHCFSRETERFLSFLQSSSFRARVTWGTQWPWLKLRAAVFLQIVNGVCMVGGWGVGLCNCGKASWNFTVSFVSEWENKVQKKP